ncbi:amino acid adenylation domain-containing protein [Methylorubrum extorquens]|uniref:amino acid adenylation domain-containing protein n=1 Tax=Methylorubrum extorquens TaxID=408 RepID=UPI00223816D5|nr:amino acid adenylation domain-containing protein [Methylorubrum extorquens]UYW29225.1 amino acid adenylation domain-containing protein [Methylorubrum extorquens]
MRREALGLERFTASQNDASLEGKSIQYCHFANSEGAGKFMQTNALEFFLMGALTNCPDKIAVIDGSIRISFAELDRQSRRLAALISRNANSLNEPVAVYLPKSANIVMANIAVMYSGSIYANIDTKIPPLRLKNILDHIKPKLIITSKERATDILGATTEVTHNQIIIIDDILEQAYDENEDARSSNFDQLIDTDPICIINTSGSTGTPKGVVLHHRGVIDFMNWVFEEFDFDESTSIGSLSPFYFDIYILELFVCLAKGATIVIIPDQVAIFPAKLMEFVSRGGVNFLFWVPSIMVNIANLGLLEKIPLPELRTIFFAGEVFPTRHLNQWRQALTDVSFVNLYGPIEIHVDCTFYVVEGDIADDQPLPIGKPCRNTDIIILNEANQLCAAGEQGELCVRGSSLSSGYWNDPEKTSRAFVQNPLNTRYPELIYRTGDLAVRRVDGLIYLVGRKDYQIKHMGYRIELLEIEHQVLRIPGIASACVVYDHPKKAITLFYQPSGQDVSQATIRRALSDIFPKYMLPTAYHSRKELPMNANGKIDRNGLVLSLAENS